MEVYALMYMYIGEWMNGRGSANTNTIVTYITCRHLFGARCRSVVERPLMDGRINSSWWILLAISRSSQYSTIGLTKAVMCAVLLVGWCI